MSIRWVPFFLPVLVAAFQSSTEQMTLILGLGEMAGLITLLIGRQLDKGRERLAILTSLGLIVVGSFVAIIGRLSTFAVAYFVLIIGVSLCTVGGHSYLSRRVLFNRRAKALGIFETSWAFGLLLGAPIAAVLIGWFDWRAPFIAYGVGAAVIAVLVIRSDDDSKLLDDAAGGDARRSLTPKAWVTIAGSATIAITGLATVVIAGTWLDEALGVSTAGVGLVAIAFGFAELTASSTSAVLADRVGPVRSTLAALLLVLVGLGVMTQAGSSLVVGGVGLMVFFLGFEFAIVTSFSIVSEAMPSARGRVLAANNAFGTLFRGIGVSLSGVLYAASGITGPAALSAVAAVASIVLLSIARRMPALV